MNEKPYFKFSDYLKERYHAKVYKLPVNIPCTCPNRDGTLSNRGCIFCGDEGAGFETRPAAMPVAQQLRENRAYMGRQYKACKFIAYFQSFSSTYLKPEIFHAYLEETLQPDIVAVYISTRPDCISDMHIASMKMLLDRGVDVVAELGLQSVNEDTLRFLNRGHGVEAFTRTAQKLHKAGIQTCAHVITDIPADTSEDVLACARYLNDTGVSQVKIHSLYILEGTELADLYRAGLMIPLSLESYLERTISFLECLSPRICIQRLIGRAPEERTVYANFGMSWWKVQALLEEKMRQEGRWQGKHFPEPFDHTALQTPREIHNE